MVTRAADFLRHYAPKGRIDWDPLKRGIQNRHLSKAQQYEMRADYWKLTDEERYRVLTTLERRRDSHSIVFLTLNEIYSEALAENEHLTAGRLLQWFFSTVSFYRTGAEENPALLWYYRYVLREIGFYATMWAGGTEELVESLKS